MRRNSNKVKAIYFTRSFCKSHRLVSRRKEVPCPPRVTGNVLALEGGLCQGQGQKHDGENILRRTSNTRGTSLSCSICSEHLRSHRSHTKCSGASQLPLGSGEEIASLKNEFIEKFTEMHLYSSVKECLSFAGKEQNIWGYRLLHFVAFSTKKTPNHHVLTRSIWHWWRQVTHRKAESCLCIFPGEVSYDKTRSPS